MRGMGNQGAKRRQETCDDRVHTSPPDEKKFKLTFVGAALRGEGWGGTHGTVERGARCMVVWGSRESAHLPSGQKTYTPPHLFWVRLGEPAVQ